MNDYMYDYMKGVNNSVWEFVSLGESPRAAKIHTTYDEMAFSEVRDLSEISRGEGGGWRFLIER